MLKSDNLDDIGITVNNVESTENHSERHRSSSTNFFVSFLARVKLLFTTALAEVCDCSIASKHHPPHGDSFSIKGDEDGLDENSSHSVKAPLNTVPTDQEPSKVALLHDCANEDIGDLQTENSEASTKPPEVAFITLLKESSHDLNKSYDSLRSCDPVTEEHLEPIDQGDEGQFSTAITFAHPTMMFSVEPEVYYSKLLQIAEKTQIFEIPMTTEEEVVMTDDFPAENVCSSSEIFSDCECSHPLTTLGRLQAKLINGHITDEEYQKLASNVISSTIPRNLSDSCETRKPRGANQLYAWQIPPPLPEMHFAEKLMDPTDQEDSDVFDESNPSAFVDSLISNAVEKFTHDCQIDGSKPLDKPDGTAIISSDNFQLQIVKPSDISYDGFQTSSLDRVRSPTISCCDATKRSKRSSSLKSERSPDDTPCRKIVRFADSLGLDLVSVRQVKDTENPPFIPASATMDLNLDKEKSFSSLGAKQYQICFSQPGASPNFIHHVLTHFVCLENARVDSSRGLLTGTIRVKSVGFEKKVAVRITYNDWSTFFEIPTSYVQDSHDGTTDRFSFSAVFPNSMVANDRAQFAIRYEIHSGVTYWDNNHGENYIVTCYAKATDMAGDGSWIHYL
ncbi:unnamed protein product [Rodentolepis nana]|uniref:CBM21 domain-containing protein n=1 Tax=Rodentolepis nana TaxID=102285 RepID=A0A0R3TAQ4_RODNA|nr:unnamed protein product [Rodentolepis nana]